GPPDERTASAGGENHADGTSGDPDSRGEAAHPLRRSYRSRRHHRPDRSPDGGGMGEFRIYVLLDLMEIPRQCSVFFLLVSWQRPRRSQLFTTAASSCPNASRSRCWCWLLTRT